MTKKDTCLILRTKGKSFREISRSLNIPLSTVYLWSKNIKLSKNQRLKLFEKSIRTLQTARLKAQKAKKTKYTTLVKANFLKGQKTISHCLSRRDTMYIGAALYWAEGFKKDNRLGFANSDPTMVNFFIYWLVNIFEVPVQQIRLRIGINSLFRDKTSSIEQFWSKSTGIPLTQFQKPFYQLGHSTRIYPNPQNYHGVIRVRANGQNHIFRQILGMVEGLKNVSLLGK